MQSTSDTTDTSNVTTPAAASAIQAPAAASPISASPSSPIQAPAASPPIPWFGRNVYVRNLPPVNPLTMEMPSEVHVMNLFARFGALEKLRVVRDRVTGQPTGHALILFKSPESAQAAIQYINHGFIYMPMLISRPSATLWLPKEVFQT